MEHLTPTVNASSVATVSAASTISPSSTEPTASTVAIATIDSRKTKETVYEIDIDSISVYSSTKYDVLFHKVDVQFDHGITKYDLFSQKYSKYERFMDVHDELTLINSVTRFISAISIDIQINEILPTKQLLSKIKVGDRLSQNKKDKIKAVISNLKNIKYLDKITLLQLLNGANYTICKNKQKLKVIYGGGDTTQSIDTRPTQPQLNDDVGTSVCEDYSSGIKPHETIGKFMSTPEEQEKDKEQTIMFFIDLLKSNNVRISDLDKFKNSDPEKYKSYKKYFDTYETSGSSSFHQSHSLQANDIVLGILSEIINFYKEDKLPLKETRQDKHNNNDTNVPTKVNNENNN
jgi:hypothetical protein